MHEPHDVDPPSTDRCTQCGRKIIEDIVVVQGDDGTLQNLCPSCADESDARHSKKRDGAIAEIDPAELAERVHELLSETIEQRAQETARLRDAGGLVDDLATRLAQAQFAALDTEEHVRSLKAEIERLRDRLRRTEELLAVASSQSVTIPGPATRTGEAKSSPQVAVSQASLTPADVRAAQRVFNESSYIEKTRSVRRGLGRPIANLAKVVGRENTAMLTVAWDIVWYQYFIDLSETAGGVTLFAEGMELSELPDNLRLGNAIIDDQGRLDASELDLSLEADHPAHEDTDDTEPDEEIEDATEEIWDRTAMPEFRWDD